jgi:hypothetical protein
MIDRFPNSSSRGRRRRKKKKKNKTNKKRSTQDFDFVWIPLDKTAFMASQAMGRYERHHDDGAVSGPGARLGLLLVPWIEA